MKINCCIGVKQQSLTHSLTSHVIRSHMIEDWKKSLDKNEYLAAILMDLSKAFGCLPHDLLLMKLKAYGLSQSALEMLNSYLTNRKQCVKIGQNTSDLLDIVIKVFLKVPYWDQFYLKLLSMICFSLYTNVNYIVMHMTTPCQTQTNL